MAIKLKCCIDSSNSFPALITGETAGEYSWNEATADSPWAELVDGRNSEYYGLAKSFDEATGIYAGKEIPVIMYMLQDSSGNMVYRFDCDESVPDKPYAVKMILPTFDSRTIGYDYPRMTPGG